MVGMAINASAAAAAEAQSARLRRIAEQHRVDPTALEQLIFESRSEARNRRRRLPDARLEELVDELGADQ